MDTYRTSDGKYVVDVVELSAHSQAEPLLRPARRRRLAESSAGNPAWPDL